MTPPSTIRAKIRNGFSLLEVILGVAIVAILVAILFPALTKMRAGAQATACSHNLRNIGVALAGYISEHNGKLIPYASLGGSPQRYWFDELDKYMGEKPDDFDRTRPHKWQLCPAKPVIPETRVTVGYGWNHRYLGYQQSDPKGGLATIHQIDRPSETIVIGDSQDIDRANPPATSSENRYLYSHNVARLASRHQGMGHYLMLDGHVLAATPEEVLDTGTGPYRRFWQKKR